MTTSHLPRRAIVGVVLATSLLGAGIAAFAEDAPAAGPCPSWTDPKGDATTGQAPVAALGDDQMDIVSSSLKNDGANVVATIGDVKMGTSASDFGDEFHINFTLNGKSMQVFADRGPSAGPLVSPVGFDAGFYNFTDKKSAAATAKYDVKANTVTITGTVAELAKSLGSDPAGKVATAIVAETQDYLPEVGVGFTYDDAATKLTFTVGADCAGGAATPASPAPASPAPAPAPAGPPPAAGGAGSADGPTPGCNTFGDPKGDASIVLQAGAPGTPNDADLDMTGLVLQSTPDDFKAYVRVDKLSTRPTYAPGHSFYVIFTDNKKVVNLIGTAYDPSAIKDVIDGVAAGTAGTPAQRSPASRMTVDGTYVPSSFKAAFDTKTSIVTLSVKRADLEKALGAGNFADGTVLTKVYARSLNATPAVGLFVDSTAKDNSTGATDADAWTVGDNACFGAVTPPVATAIALTNVGAVKAQFRDKAAVGAKLVDGSGAPLVGKQVTFTLGSSKATGTTNASGVAKALLLVTSKAGKRSLVLSAEGATATTDFTVLVEKTVLRASGSKGTVTAVLKDDDSHAVAGQLVTFTSGTKKVTARTNSAGAAKVTGFRPGSTVTVTYPGAKDMYTASKTTSKA